MRFWMGLVISVAVVGSAAANPPPQACAGLSAGFSDQAAELRRQVDHTDYDAIIAKVDGPLRDFFVRLKASREAFNRAQDHLQASLELTIRELNRCARSH